jgi:2,3-diketo-5-methylthio-1-phosphopentane phosphatase
MFGFLKLPRLIYTTPGYRPLSPDASSPLSVGQGRRATLHHGLSGPGIKNCDLLVFSFSSFVLLVILLSYFNYYTNFNSLYQHRTPAVMAATTLPAMKTSPKFIFFSDFDGTITQRDSNDFLTDTLGYGEKLRKQGNQDVLQDKISFRDSFRGMMDSVKTPYDQCIKTLCENIKLDPYFKEFYQWARQNNVPVVVLSSGMVPIIRALLVHLVGEDADDIQIVSNDVAPRDGKSINDEGGWQIVFHDER